MAGLSKVKGSGLATGAATASLVGIDDNATSTAITIDASDNVGIGVVPEAWGSGSTALQLGATSAVSAFSDQLDLSENAYWLAGGSSYRYTTTSHASSISLTNGTHVFKVAASGTENAAISWTTAMTIANDGILHKGTFSSSGATTGTKFNNGEMHSSYNGTAPRKQVYIYNPNGEVGSIESSFTSCNFNTSSDYRLKENVIPMSGSIDRLKQLKPSRFNFIAHPDRVVDGFLAHEAGAVVPECASGTKDAMKDEEYEVTPAVMDGETVVTEAVMGTRSVPDYQGIDQSKLVPLLVASLQEAVAKIEALEARVTALEPTI